MPDEEPVLSIKDQMLAEIPLDIPEGVRNFLTTPLPAGPTLTTPNDVESAIICQAEFCVWMGSMFGAYEGLTPIQIPMMIGQLNTVQHSMLVASLEVAQPSENVQSLLNIIEPVADQSYLPGELRITATADKEIVRSITAHIGESDPVPLRDVEGDSWRAYSDLPVGAYTVTVTAELFEGIEYADDMGPLEQSVDISIAEDAEEPAEGVDKAALNKAYTELSDAVRALFDVPITSLPDIIEYLKLHLNIAKTALSTLLGIAQKVATGDVGGAIEQLGTELGNYWGLLFERITTLDDDFSDGEFNGWDLLMVIGGDLRKFAATATALRNIIEGLLKE